MIARTPASLIGTPSAVTQPVRAAGLRAARARRPGLGCSGWPASRSTPRSSCPLGHRLRRGRVLAALVTRHARGSSRVAGRCSALRRPRRRGALARWPRGRRCGARSRPSLAARRAPGGDPIPVEPRVRVAASSCSTRSSPYDTAFHVGLARELTLGYPPQVPGRRPASRSATTWGTDLVRAAALRWAAVDPYDSVSRLRRHAGRARPAPAVRAAARAARRPPARRSRSPAGPSLATDFSFAFAREPAGALVGGPAAREPAPLARPREPGRPAPGAGPGRAGRASRGTRTARAAAGCALAAVLAARCPSSRCSSARTCSSAWLARAPRARRPAARAGRRAAAVRGGHRCPGPGPGRHARSPWRWRPLDLVRITRESLGLAPLSGVAPRRLGRCCGSPRRSGLRVLGLPRRGARAARGGRRPRPRWRPWRSRPGRWACSSASPRPRCSKDRRR